MKNDEVCWIGEGAFRNLPNEMIKFKLEVGNTVQYRSSDNSLWPRVHSGDVCLLEPSADHASLEIGDIVFCDFFPVCTFMPTRSIP